MSQKNTTIILEKIQIVAIDVPRVSNKFRDVIDENFINRSNFSTKRSIVLLSITTSIIFFFINLKRRDVSRISTTLFKLTNNDKNTRATINILIEKTIYSYLIESISKNLILFLKKLF